MNFGATDLPPRDPRSRLRQICLWACWLIVGLLILVVGTFAAAWNFLGRIPKSYPPARHPVEPVWASAPRTNFPAGFDSPYLGHTGSWDGKGGAMFGSSKSNDLETEANMGLRWTFMPVYWRSLEADGPVDLQHGTPPAWRELDAFVLEAHKRGLNILMQAPVIGGNAGGPPRWAGRREKGRSAPADMDAVAAFAGKLAARYAPGGTLAVREGWGNSFGVRAWEIDNEPDSYLTHWKGQAADYAEFLQKVSRAIKHVDPLALILAPATPASKESLTWITAALGAHLGPSSPGLHSTRKGWSIGPEIDVVSFHIYEGLDSAFSGEDRDIEMAFDELQDVFERAESSAGFAFARKSEYWHTEGNFDFLGILSAPRRAAWRMQFMTRAFAAGVAKVCVMDACPAEQVAVRGYVEALPNPFPMCRMSNQVDILSGRAMVYWHPGSDQPAPGSGGVWVLWAEAGAGNAVVSVPVERAQAILRQVDGTSRFVSTAKGRVRIDLRGDAKMPPPVLLIDLPPAPPR
jgi:hypothetical protein